MPKELRITKYNGQTHAYIADEKERLDFGAILSLKQLTALGLPHRYTLTDEQAAMPIDALLVMAFKDELPRWTAKAADKPQVPKEVADQLKA